MRSTILVFVLVAAGFVSTGVAQSRGGSDYARPYTPREPSRDSSFARARQAIWHAQAREHRPEDPGVSRQPQTRKTVYARSRRGRANYRRVSGQEPIPDPSTMQPARSAQPRTDVAQPKHTQRPRPESWVNQSSEFGGVVDGGVSREWPAADGYAPNDIVHDGYVHNGTIRPGMIHNGPFHDGMVHDEMGHDGMIHGSMIDGRMGHDGLIHDGMVHDGMMHGGMVHDGMVHDGMMHGGMVHDGMVHHGSVHGGMLDDGMMHDGMMHEGMVHEGMVHDDACGCDMCAGGPSCYPGVSLGAPWGNIVGRGNLGVELGVHGFKGPPNLGVSGSFGFNQSINFGVGLSIIPYSGIGWQLGVRTLQSNLSGTEFSTADRNQTFFTTGLFRQASRRGLQWGLVVDLLSDDWYSDTTIRQGRGEIGWRFSPASDWGYWFTFGGDEDATLRPDIPTERPPGTTLDVWSPINLNALFYRTRIGRIRGSSAKFFLGASGDSDGLLGVDTTLPLGRYWGIRSGFTYLIPDQSAENGGFENEAWNLGVALTWNFKGNCGRTQFTPLLNVADNGNFIVDRVSAR